ncbi:helix-turn-helix domain-containing protein [Kurthia sibirica]|uniref:XRE family transcriptional regulator n=1 Tax=Kurthia sibirica TaxID=202750 RepID=A0A2U3APC1_9BACL|nr:helix-turn-helix transcriptional regulator [Kurthia sibirica]PWI26356.1 XRE family transcriptional regulator [Kurthia sibirica]GEK34856.1 hypothetical protein KSI01_23890 [Kurthia sibirica]
MSTFGSRLRKLRKQKTPHSMKEFGKIFGLSESAIGMYERDEREPDFKTLNEMAEYLEVSTDYLLGRSDDSTVFSKEDKNFEAFANDPSLQKWYKELPESKEEDLRRLRKMWEILKDNGDL